MKKLALVSAAALLGMGAAHAETTPTYSIDLPTIDYFLVYQLSNPGAMISSISGALNTGALNGSIDISGTNAVLSGEKNTLATTVVGAINTNDTTLSTEINLGSVTTAPVVPPITPTLFPAADHQINVFNGAINVAALDGSITVSSNYPAVGHVPAKLSDFTGTNLNFSTTVVGVQNGGFTDLSNIKLTDTRGVTPPTP